ncbi:MAG: glucose 1-dehydrogenase [Nitrososphaerota archaeon]|nr:glucose 1-dehydrogenase [Nitrososphaerota archaeon]
MKAITVIPKKQDSLKVQEFEVPKPAKRELLLEVQKVGICGTDRDIISGFYGEAPAGDDYLVLGHESLSRVAGLGAGVRGFKKGDLVVPTVRRNCPENCIYCTRGQSDMCVTGNYLEHGIKGLHGFAREFAITDSDFVVKLPESLRQVGVLLEPLTIVEKGMKETFRIQKSRMKKWSPKKVLVLGAGPVGLLATALLRLSGVEVEAVARSPEDSLKAKLVEQTGASYTSTSVTPLDKFEDSYDLVFELTGNTSVALEAQNLTSVNGVVSYLGVYKEEQATENAGKIYTNLVLGNRVQFGSVNANKTYFVMGVRDLQKIKRKWSSFLERIITTKVKLDNYEEAYAPRDREDIKTILELKS